MFAEKTSLPELFERFLKASIDELDPESEFSADLDRHSVAAVTEVLANTRDRIAAQLDNASSTEIEQGLHTLWRLTRHVSREECWWELRNEYAAAGEIRSDVLDWWKDEEERLVRPMPIHDAISALRATKTQWEEERKARKRRAAVVDEFVKRHYSGTNPILRNLRIVKEDGYWENYWCCYEIHDWNEEVLRSLVALAPRFEARLGRDRLFWAVFGPFADAIALKPAGGFEDEIDEARSWMLATRIQSGRGDLCDYWLLLEREDGDDEEGKGVAVARLIAYVEHATSAECEDFFRAFDLEYAGEPAAESGWPGADALWTNMLRKQDLSLQLLGRAGRYYWCSAARRSGPSEALAAWGMDSMFCLRYDVCPFLAFWAAARAAAEEHRWQLSADCLNAALLDVSLQVPFLDGKGLRLVEDERFDVRFVGELCIRFKEDIDSSRLPLRECLLLALESARGSQLDAMTELPRALEEIGRKVWVQKLQASEVVLKSIGADVRGRIRSETWDILLAAELAWLSQDYAAVGVHYRRALENEWRSGVGPMLLRFTGESLDRMAPGEMMRMLLTTLGRGTIARAFVTQQMGPTNPLLRGRILEDAIEVCDTFLNEAAHARGLDRRQCEDLRGRLLADGLLRKCLLGVQAPGPA